MSDGLFLGTELSSFKKKCEYNSSFAFSQVAKALFLFTFYTFCIFPFSHFFEKIHPSKFHNLLFFKGSNTKYRIIYLQYFRLFYILQSGWGKERRCEVNYIHTCNGLLGIHRNDLVLFYCFLLGCARPSQFSQPPNIPSCFIQIKTRPGPA